MVIQQGKKNKKNKTHITDSITYIVCAGFSLFHRLICDLMSIDLEKAKATSASTKFYKIQIFTKLHIYTKH